jgi:TatD DNase family protein
VIARRKGNAAGDNFGMAVTGIGNGEGTAGDEFAVGAPFNDQNGVDAGKVVVFRGGAAGVTGVYAAVGIQPNYTGEAAEGDWEAVVELVRAPGVVAIGETGLDRYWDHTSFDVQQDYFDRHLRLSQETGLPFIVHLRECEADILAMLREARLRGPLAGVMHSYTGTAAGAAESVELGLHVSFAGMVTFKKSAELREMAATVPDDHILIETDAPYLAPHPKRGRRNEPALVLHTAECLAETRGVSLDDFARQTTRNARRFFGLDD